MRSKLVVLFPSVGVNHESSMFYGTLNLYFYEGYDCFDLDLPLPFWIDGLKLCLDFTLVSFWTLGGLALIADPRLSRIFFLIDSYFFYFSYNLGLILGEIEFLIT